MSDITYQRTVVAFCVALSLAVLYLQRRYLFAPPDYTVTRAMIEKAEMEAIFGPEYEFLDDDDEE